MIEIKHLDECTFQTALEIWNRGFRGYPIDLTLTLDALLARITSHGISPEFSLLGFIDNEPVGFLLNGFRSTEKGKLAWNGGTGVVPELRGKGIGRMLVEEALDLYRKQSVDIAVLEAIATNESAIRLYKHCGYEVVDELTFLQHDDLIYDWITRPSFKRYNALEAVPAAIGKLNFYYEFSPWQTQWQSVVLAGGEGVLVQDSAGVTVGYALFKKKFTGEGEVESIGLFQCEVAPGRADAGDIALFMLQNVFAAELGKFKRITYNLRKSNQLVVNLLLDAGFTTFIEQVHMMRKV